MKRLAVFTIALAFAAFTAAAMLQLAPPTIDLRGPVAEHLDQSGVSHPVTAVLLNYRGYDTLLEIAVLLLALLAILAISGRQDSTPARPAHAALQAMARVAAPPAIMLAAYLLWAGAFRPGGAFQAGAVLAAAAVMLHLVGLLRGWGLPGLRLRLGLAAGFSVFLAVASVLAMGGTLLAYPPEFAGELILLIEAGLTISLGLILAGLFLCLAREGESS